MCNEHQACSWSFVFHCFWLYFLRRFTSLILVASTYSYFKDDNTEIRINPEFYQSNTIFVVDHKGNLSTFGQTIVREVANTNLRSFNYFILECSRRARYPEATISNISWYMKNTDAWQHRTRCLHSYVLSSFVRRDYYG